MFLIVLSVQIFNLYYNLEIVFKSIIFIINYPWLYCDSESPWTCTDTLYCAYHGRCSLYCARTRSLWSSTYI